MTDTVFGQIVNHEGVRDAIHVATISVRAGEILYPGAHVKVVDGLAIKTRKNEEGVGIVDPFLSSYVDTGVSFWLFLRPGTITGLRHVWEHPAFSKSTVVEKAMDSNEARVHQLAEEIGFSYDRVMRDYDHYIRFGDYTYDNSESYKDIPDEYWEALARHYKTLNPNIEINDKYGAPVPYTCTC